MLNCRILQIKLQKGHEKIWEVAISSVTFYTTEIERFGIWTQPGHGRLRILLDKFCLFCVGGFWPPLITGVGGYKVSHKTTTWPYKL